MNARTGDFHPDGWASHSLPGHFYHEPEQYRQELVRIFQRTWQYVCHVSRLEQPGAFKVRDIAEQSVLVLRGQDLQLRAFHNVCQHRAHRLLEGAGRLRGPISCPYHTWRYDDHGALLHAPHSRQVPDFRADVACLQTVRLEVFCGLVFVNLDPAAPSMQALLPDLEAQIRSFQPAPEALQHSYSKSYPLLANWKVSVENYSECYHCPSCHPSLTHQTLDLRSYRIDLQSGFHSHLSADQGTRQGYPVAGDAPRANEFGAWYLWPNLCIEVYPGGYMNLLHHIPQGAERCEQVVEWFTAQATPDAEEQAVIDFVAVVREEDLPLCQSVQEGLHSLGYRGGRLIIDPAHSGFAEHAVHDIQKKVLLATSGTEPDHE